MSHNWQAEKMPTATKSLTAMSLSCLAEGLDEEAVDVENRAESREKPRREAMVYSKGQSAVRGRTSDETRNDGMAITRDRRSLLQLT
jgi:hypothetical protein